MIICNFENGTRADPGLRHVVVDVLVLKGNNILLVKRTQKLLEGGKWALVGGYVSINETLKESVEREVFEETGYRIKDIILFRIIDNPQRPNEDRQNISFVFTANVLEKEGKPDWENDEQRWFRLTQLPSKEVIAFDHYNDINLFLTYKKSSFPLPLLGEQSS